MNIAIISPWIYPRNTGGVELFNYYLIKELAARGHKIWVFTCCDHSWKNENIQNVRLWSGIPGITFLSISFSLIINLIRLKSKIDIVHVPYTSNSSLVYPMLFAKKLSGIPYFITIHGGGMYKWKPKMPHQLFFKYADAIVAVSEIIKTEYERRSGREIRVIPPLLPFKKSKYSKDKLRKMYDLSNDDTIILYLGSIKKIKGSDILLQAFLNLGIDYIRRNNLKLLFAGDGNMRPLLEEKIDGDGFSDCVKFFGSVPHAKVPDMYKLADIYVIPSLFEGAPIALLEAKFNGLPIIGTNVVGINSLITHKKNGLLFEKGNIDELKEKIIELIEDKNLYKRLIITEKINYKDYYRFNYMVTEYIKMMEKNLENQK